MDLLPQVFTREKAPIYTMGSPDVRSFSRGKRGCAGSLIWINFDRHALLNIFRQTRGHFVANRDDIRPQFRIDLAEKLDQTASIAHQAGAKTRVLSPCMPSATSGNRCRFPGWSGRARPRGSLALPLLPGA